MSIRPGPGDQPRTTVVVVTWRGREHISACLDGLAAQTRSHSVLVVDNASDDGTAAIVAGHRTRPPVLRLTENTGYAGGIAAGLARLDTPFMAWLNDDAVPDPGWLAALEDALDADPTIAAGSAKLLTAAGEVQSVGVRLTSTGHGMDLTEAAGDVFGFCGGAALVRTDALRDVGGVPAEFFCYYEDTDTSWRLRLAGWRIASVPAATVTHAHGASTRPGSRQFHLWNERNRLLMLLRCAPTVIAIRELARFALITALLPIRRAVQDAANFQVGLRLRVLAEVLARTPAAIKSRARFRKQARFGSRAGIDSHAESGSQAGSGSQAEGERGSGA